ncbi:MAG: helix-turn-helix domain-containing protein [Nitrososphaerota archaeon]|nr:helix-turn-helix domain-containing protein [Nitrososphaerota archaeon]MDG6975792.1 helix-turn-helix domain-containing protein [Nitrososphaerota archaeon]MDG7010371.1 helix-turn-helix domain-containing protein [Nitrososphaerota archaeon]MDG7020032.1 helix-turn-helix domain-containing protein [Nitrososphaerota archaeon]MDG7027195.1 helix-turn-helix domain-containing protein [Nitrososphaerota archaeon]
MIALVSNPANAQILSALMGAESYPRELARRLGMRESHVSERLKTLERFGLVKGRWTRMKTAGKNVKSFASAVSSVRIGLDEGGLKFAFERRDSWDESLELEQQIYKVRVPPVGVFVGRKRELDALLGKSSGLSVVTGVAGIGKTTLVSKLASIIAGGNEKPEGATATFWHDIRESDSLRYVIAKLAAFLSGHGYPALSDLVRKGVSDEGALIGRAQEGLELVRGVAIFDDYHYCRDSGITRFLQRLGESSTVRTIVVSRTRPTELYTGSRLVPELSLEGHTEEEAAELFEANGVHLARDEMARVNATLKGNPLALSLMCKSVNAMGKRKALEVTLSEVRDHILIWLQSVLTPPEMETLWRMSVFRGPVPLDAVRAVEPGGARDVVLAQRIGALERAGVVTRIGDGFLVHDAARDALSVRPGQIAAAHSRTGDYYASEGDRRSTLEAIYHYVKGGQTASALHVIRDDDAYTRIVDEGYVEPLLRLAEELLAGPLPSADGESRVRGWLMVVRAYALWRMQKQYALVLRSVREAEAAGRRCGDSVLIASALMNKSYVLSALGDTKGAERALRTALGVPGLQRDGPIVAAYLMENLVDAMVTEGRFGEAIRFGSSAVEIFERNGDMRNLAGALASLGVCHYMKGDFNDALSLIARARPRVPAGNKVIGEYVEEATGLVLERMGRKRQALVHLNRGLRLGRESANRLVTLEVLSERILLRAKLGNFRKAKMELKEALELKHVTERKYSLGVLELAQAGLSLVDRDLNECRTHLRGAGQLLSDDTVSRARVLWWQGVVDAQDGNIESSRRRLTEAKRAFERVGAGGYVVQVDSVRAKIEASPPRNAREALALLW